MQEVELRRVGKRKLREFLDQSKDLLQSKRRSIHPDPGHPQTPSTQASEASALTTDIEDDSEIEEDDAHSGDEEEDLSIRIEEDAEDGEVAATENASSGDLLALETAEPFLYDNVVLSSTRSPSPSHADSPEEHYRLPVPFLLRAHLRPYQRSGLDWLVQLHDQGLSGILAGM
jgi:SNF2 family DNA or RNA helicase